MRHPRMDILDALGGLLVAIVKGIGWCFVKVWNFTKEKMGRNKKTKARKTREGYMGSAPKVHRPKKGKGSYRRRQ